MGTSLCGPFSKNSPSKSTTFCLRAARNVDTIASKVLLHISSSIKVTNLTLWNFTRKKTKQEEERWLALLACFASWWSAVTSSKIDLIAKKIDTTYTYVPSGCSDPRRLISFASCCTSALTSMSTGMMISKTEECKSGRRLYIGKKVYPTDVNYRLLSDWHHLTIWYSIGIL